MGAPKGNKFALGNNGGRPPLFESAEALIEKITEYFNDQEEKHTITGLALFLGFESRQSLTDYENKNEYSYIIKRAKLCIENSYELSGTTIDIFALKNMGWYDKTEHQVNGSFEHTLTQVIIENPNK